MQTGIFIALAFIMGIIMAIYLPMNSSVSRYIGSSITANGTFFIVASLTSIFIFFVWGDIGTVPKIKNVPIYLYLTGVISAFFVLGTTFLIPHVGARKFFILLITGQIVMSLFVSHWGILESPRDPISLRKVIGAAIVIIGAIVSTYDR